MSYISGEHSRKSEDKKPAPKKATAVPKGIKEGTSTAQFWRKKK